MPHRQSISKAMLLPMAVAVLTALVGCGDASRPATGLSVQIDTLVDTIRVQNLSGSEWGDTARLEPVVAVGASDGPDEYLLGRVAALAVGPAGRIYLTDRQVPALRAYDASGRYIRTFGREGSGPGEYQQPDGGLAALGNGDLIIRDPGNGRMIVYDSTGVGQDQWQITGGLSTGRKLYRSADDQLYTLMLDTRNADPLQWKYGLFHYLSDGTLVDTMNVPDLGYTSPQVTGRSESSSSTQFVPFTPNAPWTFAPTKAVVTGIGDVESFTVFRHGSPLIISRETAPVPVLAEEGAEARDRITWQMNRNFPGWTWNGPDIPETKPAFSNLIPTEDGSFWVQVATRGRPTMTAEEAASRQREGQPPPNRFESPVVYDVFDGDGRYQGSVTTPEGFKTYPEPVVRGDTVWAMFENPDTGTPQVVRYLVVRGTMED